MRIGGVLLAAGEGKRFGGNKLLEKVNGVPIILMSLNALESLERVIIVGAYASELLPLLKEEVVIYNPRWREGISTSVKLGLRYFSDYDAVVFHLADMPLVKHETVKAIIDAFDPGECDAVVPKHNGIRGNPVLISKAIFKRAEELKGDEGFRRLLNEVRLCHIEAGEEVLIDIDTKSDLKRISSFRLRP